MSETISRGDLAVVQTINELWEEADELDLMAEEDVRKATEVKKAISLIDEEISKVRKVVILKEKDKLEAQKGFVEATNAVMEFQSNAKLNKDGEPIESLETLERRLEDKEKIKNAMDEILNLSLGRIPDLAGKREANLTAWEVLQGKAKALRRQAENNRLEARGLEMFGLEFISGTTERGSRFVTLCSDCELHELSDELRKDITTCDDSSWSKISEDMKPGRYGSVETEAYLTGSWKLLLDDLHFPHHIVVNTSNRPLFGTSDKPDLSIVHFQTLEAHLMWGDRNRDSGRENLGSVRRFDAEDLKLLGWSSVDLILEVKTSISVDGRSLSKLGKQAADQVYHRLGCMRHYSFAVIADREHMMFFHSRGTVLARKCYLKPFWRRSRLVNIKDGLIYLRKLLFALHLDWTKENSMVMRRISFLKDVRNGIATLIGGKGPFFIEILHESLKKSGGASVFVLSGSRRPSIVLKVVQSGRKGDRCDNSLIEREQRRLEALNRMGISGVPQLLNLFQGGRIESTRKGLAEWEVKGGKKYLAMVCTPYAKGGTLRHQLYFLHDRPDGGIILCRIIKAVACTLLRAHSTLIAEDCSAMHGDVKPSNIVLADTVMESPYPQTMLIDWEHSMRLRDASLNPRGCGAELKTGEESPNKVEAHSESVGSEEVGEYVSVCTPDYCARSQQPGSISKRLGPEVDWEALFFTFVFMADRHKLTWLRPISRQEIRTKYGSMNVEQACFARAEQIISQKTRLLHHCRDGLWDGTEHEREWRFRPWSQPTVQKIKDLLQIWATWILKGEMRAPEGPNRLVARLEYITTEH